MNVVIASTNQLVSAVARIMPLSRARRFTTAAPILRLPPVIKAHLCSSVRFMSLLLCAAQLKLM
jgi:hypothetical protein